MKKKIKNEVESWKPFRVRYEAFGGIVGLERPPFLLFVNKTFMKKMGYRFSPLWNQKRKYLSAPTEVHFSLTNKCPFACRVCYANSSREEGKELSTKECKKVLRILSKMGVFHIAFGGGEPFERKDLFELARYCRKLGMIPNVTTNGYYITKKLAKESQIFGRINVSLDGIGEKYKEIRGIDGFEVADRAIRLLVEAGNRVGINCILCRKNFNEIWEIIKYAKDRKIADILFLRFKPAGRGAKHYWEMKLSPQQNKDLWPKLLTFQNKTNVVLEIDCAFFPMICYHNPPPKLLHFFTGSGCVAGDILLGVLPTGQFQACSHCRDTGGSVLELSKKWDKSEHLRKFREWKEKSKEPCKSCKYLRYCRGGCHVVAEYVTGDFFNPDPECPLINDFINGSLLPI